MNDYIKLVIAAILGGLIVWGVLSVTSQSFGVRDTSNITNPFNFQQGLTSTTGTFSGAITSGGDLTVTTSNTATSTITVGCVQTYATSTATPIHWSMDLTSTSTAANQYGTTVGGLVTWGYGSCAI